MSYNYRQEFLFANRHIVDRLIKAADNGEWIRLDCANPAEAAAKQYLISNLLASLSRWEPGRAYVRQSVRTSLKWGEPGTGQCYLYVGVPPVGTTIKGIRPSPFLGERTEAKPSGRLELADKITGDSWPVISLGLLKAKSQADIVEIVLQHPPDENGIRFIAEQLSPEFEVISTQPHFVLRRV